MLKLLTEKKFSIILFFLTTFIFFYLIQTNNWELFIGSNDKIFMDYQANIKWLKCNYLNFDVYKTNSCFPNKVTYGPAIFFFSI